MSGRSSISACCRSGAAKRSGSRPKPRPPPQKTPNSCRLTRVRCAAAPASALRNPAPARTGGRKRGSQRIDWPPPRASVDLRDQGRERHAARRGQRVQAVPEGALQGDAGAMSGDGERVLDDRSRGAAGSRHPASSSGGAGIRAPMTIKTRRLQFAQPDRRLAPGAAGAEFRPVRSGFRVRSGARFLLARAAQIDDLAHQRFLAKSVDGDDLVRCTVAGGAGVSRRLRIFAASRIDRGEPRRRRRRHRSANRRHWRWPPLVSTSSLNSRSKPAAGSEKRVMASKGMSSISGTFLNDSPTSNA